MSTTVDFTLELPAAAEIQAALHSPFTVVYDACVLYPAPLRDFLMWLALSGCFRARWSERIHGEWKRNLLKNRPDLTQAQRDRTSALMDAAVSVLS